MLCTPDRFPPILAAPRLILQYNHTRVQSISRYQHVDIVWLKFFIAPCYAKSRTRLTGTNMKWGIISNTLIQPFPPKTPSTRSGKNKPPPHIEALCLKHLRSLHTAACENPGMLENDATWRWCRWIWYMMKQRPPVSLYTHSLTIVLP